MARRTRNTNVKTAATSGNIKLDAPRGRRKPVSSKVAPVVKKPVTGFLDFLREHAIVGLAIGFIVGAQARELVDQLMKSFIDPFVGVIIGADALSRKTATVMHGGHETVFTWGAFLYSLINFLAVLAVVYLVIKIFSLDSFDKKEDK